MEVTGVDAVGVIESSVDAVGADGDLYEEISSDGAGGAGGGRLCGAKARWRAHCVPAAGVGWANDS